MPLHPCFPQTGSHKGHSLAGPPLRLISPPSGWKVRRGGRAPPPGPPGQARPALWPRVNARVTSWPKGRRTPRSLRDGQDRDHTSATGPLGASRSLCPVALGRGTWSPRLGAPARGDVCPAKLGETAPPTPQSLASLGEWRQQGPAQPRVVDTASVWGSQSHCQAEEGPACQTGAPQLPSALRPFPPAPPGRC